MINIDSVLKINKIVYSKDYSKHSMYILNDYINNKIIDDDRSGNIYVDDVIDNPPNFFSTK